MSKQAKKGLVPDLRFPKFRKSGEWSAQPLRKACQMKAGTFVQAAEIFEKEAEGLYPCYGGNGLRGFTRSYTHEGTYPLIGRQGAHCGNVVWAEGRFHATEHAVVAAPNEGVNTRWLYHVLDHAHLNQYATGQAQPGLSVEGLEKVEIPFTDDQDEQHKIAACLSSLDALLTAEREKLEALRAHKKGLMQQLFPAEGAKVPKLRFPGFKGSWSAESLGTLALKVGSGITPRGGDKTYLKEGRIFIRSQNVGWGVLLLDEVAYIDEETHQTFPGTEIRVNDVLLNLSGASIGRCALADERLAGGNVNQHVCIIRVNDVIHPVYLEQFILSKPGQKQIDSFQAGGNRQGLNYDQVRSFSIPLPADKDEQKEIALCLSSIDERIALQEERVGILQDHKKGLLQGLFPEAHQVEG